MTDRIVALIDMDCFYCQVETRLNPQLEGLPLAVVQYNEWKGGGIIAVNYEARDRGVTRHMRGADAKEQCPEIVLVKVPTLRDKADLTRYREAGREVVSVLCTFSECVERASVDEAYLDLTAAVERRIAEKSSQVSANDLENTFIVGYTKENSNNEDERVHGINNWLRDVNDSSFQDVAAQKLAVGAAIVEEIRRAVYKATGFRCSAGIAHNKVLAKLCCGFHKPNRQTVVPQSSIIGLYKTLPAKKVRSLGGKLGDDLENRLGIKVMADLEKFSENELQKNYDMKTGTWLYNIARGYDFEAVTPRLISKSIGCCKKFPGRTALKTYSDINHWITKLAEELLERLIEDQRENKRRAQLLTISMGLEVKNKYTGSTKSLNFPGYCLEKIVKTAYNALSKVCSEDPNTKIWTPPVQYLGLSAGKFVNEVSNKINTFFKVTTEPFETSTDKLCPKEDYLPSLTEEKEVLQNNNKDDIINIKQSEERKLSSFFEKKLYQGPSKNNSLTEEKEKLQKESNNKDDLINKRSDGKKVPSFFEKMLFQGPSKNNSFTEENEVLQKESNKNDMINIKQSEEKKLPSFFEKMLLQGPSKNKGNLNILPDLNKPVDLRNDDSRDSCVADKSISSNTAIVGVLRKEDHPSEVQVFSDTSSVIANDNNNSGKEGREYDKKDNVKNKTNKKSISYFFSSSATKEKWINPEEVFPDLQNIDNAVLDMFPPSYRKKILELKLKTGESCIKDLRTHTEIIPSDIVHSAEDKNLTKCKTNDDNVSPDNEAQSNNIKCSECGETVPNTEQILHLDLHVAIKLDNELNSRHTADNCKMKIFANIQPKNKRKPKSNHSNSKVTKKPKSIEDFFNR
ncbi:DNA polymerase eta [Rhodnius prolixus]|uniref:DNA polymerase eta n=1 Tax=Rhodnius prolixus TaxID=13249 RepID=UPI003D18B832